METTNCLIVGVRLMKGNCQVFNGTWLEIDLSTRQVILFSMSQSPVKVVMCFGMKNRFRQLPRQSHFWVPTLIVILMNYHDMAHSLLFGLLPPADRWHRVASSHSFPTEPS